MWCVSVPLLDSDFINNSSGSILMVMNRATLPQTRLFDPTGGDLGQPKRERGTLLAQAESPRF